MDFFKRGLVLLIIATLFFTLNTAVFASPREVTLSWGASERPASVFWQLPAVPTPIERISGDREATVRFPDEDLGTPTALVVVPRSPAQKPLVIAVDDITETISIDFEQVGSDEVVLWGKMPQLPRHIRRARQEGFPEDTPEALRRIPSVMVGLLVGGREDIQVIENNFVFTFRNPQTRHITPIAIEGTGKASVVVTQITFPYVSLRSGNSRPGQRRGGNASSPPTQPESTIPLSQKKPDNPGGGEIGRNYLAQIQNPARTLYLQGAQAPVWGHSHRLTLSVTLPDSD